MSINWLYWIIIKISKLRAHNIYVPAWIFIKNMVLDDFLWERINYMEEKRQRVTKAN